MEQHIYKEVLKKMDDYFFIDEQNLLEDYINESKFASLGKSVEEIFEENGIDVYFEDSFSNYRGLNRFKKVEFINFIMMILQTSVYNQDSSNKLIQEIVSYLAQNDYSCKKNKNGYLQMECYTLIGEGSYANVFKYKEGQCIKILREKFIDDEEFVKRLKYEYENTEKLKKVENIIKVCDYFKEKSAYSMQEAELNLDKYFDGIDFEKKFFLEIVLKIVNALESAHEETIIHRDLHPGNILFIGDNPYISDFGLSKDLSIERSFQSNSEQRNNHIFMDPRGLVSIKSLDNQADIYSFGKILGYIFEIATIPNKEEYMFILKKCIEPDLSKRFSNFFEVKEELEKTMNRMNKKLIKEQLLNDLESSTLNSDVHEFVFRKISEKSLSKFILEKNLTEFYDLIFQFPIDEQEIIVKSIRNTLAEATGYGGWGNYPYFTRLGYSIYMESYDDMIKEWGKVIVKECVDVGNNFLAQDLLIKIENDD